MSSTTSPDNHRKIGEGHLQAMLRQGLRELQNAVMTESNIAREAEPGTFGSPTQGEIAAERRSDPEAPIMDRHTQDAARQAQRLASRERGVHDGPSMEPDEPDRS